MKKKGSILIEALGAVSIVMISTVFICRSYIDDVNYLKKRILNVKACEIADNVAKEFKYNLSFREIDYLLIDGGIGFKYDENFSNNLMYNDIRNLEYGEDIIIKKLDERDEGIKYEVKVSIKDDECEEEEIKEFIKSWWMDEA